MVDDRAGVWLEGSAVVGTGMCIALLCHPATGADCRTVTLTAERVEVVMADGSSTPPWPAGSSPEN